MMKKFNLQKPSYEGYREHMRLVADLRYSSALLQWDQETYLPSKAAELRGQQIGSLTELAHTLFTDEKFGDLITTLLERDLDSEDQKINLQLTLEDYQRQKKFSPEFVRKLSELTQKSFHSWMKARELNDFNEFAPVLEQLVDMKIQEAETIGYTEHCYDALLNDYDKGSTVCELDRIFGELTPSLQQKLDSIGRNAPLDDTFLKLTYPKDLQWKFGLEVLKDMGYDFEAGRQDLSEHPFTVNMGNTDVRITTRIDEQDFSNMLWSCIHEGGHALYEQGLPGLHYGLPLGEAASYAIHESQSRMWENQMGRSKDFCQFYLPRLKEIFPAQLGTLTESVFFKGINKVAPSLIRTEADELTYHLHVIIRYEIEKMLIGGELKVKDIKSFWNESYKRRLGVEVPDDKRGCLQDVHWSHGSFGYFPTYSTGSLYAAQLFAKATRDIENWESVSWLEKTSKLKNWLSVNVFTKGRRWSSGELAEKITGETLNPRHFINYIETKIQSIY